MNLASFRKDFPILQKKERIIYFDNSCVTLKPIQVIEAVNRYYREFPACGGRSMHKLGKKVTEEVENTRRIMQKFIGARSSNEIIFTKNTTEGINLIANSLNFKKDDVVLTTDKEHNSNLLPWIVLSKKGIKHEVVKSNDDGTFNMENFKEKIKDVRLVSFVHMSNLDGTTTPIKDIINIAHENNALVLVDAAQSIPHKEINVSKLDADFVAFSGHKMLGPSGTGVLYVKQNLLEKLSPFIVGGETVINSTYNSFELEKPPQRFEAGLQHYAGIIGLGEAARYLTRVGKQNIEKHELMLNKKITDALPEAVEILGPKEPELRSGIISFNVKNMDPHEVALMLDEAGIMVRSGMHCVHSWFNAHNIKGSVRASLYFYNTEEECDIFIKELKKITSLA